MPNSFFEYSAQNLKGETTPLNTFKGKVCLVVNTASACGFTPQYKDLQDTYTKYRDRGLEVLAFPSNDFGAQEPGSNEEIKQFCELKYRTTFPLFGKGPVSGVQKQPVFKFLTEEAHPEQTGEIAWNFEKFLIDRNGRLIKRFKSKAKPSDPEFTQAIESLL